MADTIRRICGRDLIRASRSEIEFLMSMGLLAKTLEDRTRIVIESFRWVQISSRRFWTR